MDKKTIIATVSGLAVAALFALLWNTFSAGVESQLAENPAIQELEALTSQNQQNLVSYTLATESRLVRLETKIDLVIDNQNLMLDRLTQ